MPRKNCRDWSRAALSRLSREGIDGVRVEVLAKDLGVTKGSFYWHFRDRQALLDAMLEEWRASATEDVILRAEQGGTSARARLERLVEIATRGFDAELELALRAWSRSDPKVREAVEEIDAKRLATLRRLLRESGFDGADLEARAFLFYSAVLGAGLLPEAHGRFGRPSVLSKAVDILGVKGKKARASCN